MKTFADLKPGDVFRFASRRARVLTKVGIGQARDAFGERVEAQAGWEVLPVKLRHKRDETRASAKRLRERALEALGHGARHTYIAPEQLLELIEVAEGAAA